MGFDRYRRRLGFLLALAALPLTVTSAGAEEEDFRAPQYSFWKPDIGWTSLSHPGANDGPFLKVDRYFEWSYPQMTYLLAGPRLPGAGQTGNYEHELRFFTDGQGWWCDPRFLIHNRYNNLPQDSYRDEIVADNEDTWGVQSWRIVSGRLYRIYGECWKDIGNASPDNGGRFSVSGQIGHCHTGPNCSWWNTYADETVRLSPKAIGWAPTTSQHDTMFEFWPSFASAYHDWSFESDPGPQYSAWRYFNSSREIRCGPNAYVNSCFLKLTQDGSQWKPRIEYTFDVPDPVGTSSVYNEIVARCPGSNSTNCRFRLIEEGLNAAGARTIQYVSNWMEINRDGRWYGLDTKAPEFPAGTTKWKFKVQTEADQISWFDFSSQWYYRPNDLDP